MSQSEPGPKEWPVALVIFFATFLLTASTISHYGLTWDEPAYFHASDLHIGWLTNVLNGTIRDSLKDEAIKASWHWDPYHVPHPPFSRILSGITKTLFSPFADKFTAYRLSPALLFALLTTVMYVWVTATFNRTMGLFSVLALILTPNLFAFAHLAVTDLPLATMWFLTVYCFVRGLQDWKWSLLLGIVWGLALSTKFPALLIPLPLIFWAHIFHRRTYANNVFAMVFLSPLVMIASQPYLWHQTFLRVLEFLHEGVSRAYRPETNYTIFFFNNFYFSSDLPWYYPFFIMAVTTPETILMLCLAGIASIFSQKAQKDMVLLWLFNALFVLSLGLLPGAVLHDGVRQFISALPFLAALASTGFVGVFELVTRWAETTESLSKISHLRAKILAVMFFLAVFVPTTDLWIYHPYELSYYNRFMGGLQGAYKRGLEVTYFMEAFTPDFLQRLNVDLPPNVRINASFANFMFEYYQKENRLRADIQITHDDDFDYYILLYRKSTFSERDFAFVATKPYLHHAVRLHGVPLGLLLRPRA